MARRTKSLKGSNHRDHRSIKNRKAFPKFGARLAIYKERKEELKHEQ